MERTIKLVIAAVALLITCLALAGCGKEESQPPSHLYGFTPAQKASTDYVVDARTKPGFEFERAGIYDQARYGASDIARSGREAAVDAWDWLVPVFQACGAFIAFAGFVIAIVGLFQKNGLAVGGGAIICALGLLLAGSNWRGTLAIAAVIFVVALVGLLALAWYIAHRYGFHGRHHAAHAHGAHGGHAPHGAPAHGGGHGHHAPPPAHGGHAPAHGHGHP